MSHTFTISGRLPSMNDTVGANRKNPHCGAKLKKDADAVVVYSASAAQVPYVDTPVHVHCVWYERNKMRDPDNFCAGIKFVLDGLQKAGVIDDDSWGHVKGFSHEWYVDKANPRIEVTLS